MADQESSGRVYLAIDLKSFYASVECVERKLDPFKARLVVADESRTDKTICLAVSPALKSLGFPGRLRLGEAKDKARKLGTDFIIAMPRMQLYIDYSSFIYSIYLQFVSSVDIFVYSIDEVFIDATSYIGNQKAEDFARKIVKTIFDKTGITATVGIGTNLYLAKVAMDIIAKHKTPDENGARIASLDEMSFRRELWTHKPLTDFWRIGPSTERKLNNIDIYTMGDIARCSLGKKEETKNEDLLFKVFGVSAELLIDHAWGIEPTKISDIKSFIPKNTSLSLGQVLKKPTVKGEVELILLEMADRLALNLTEKCEKANKIIIEIVVLDGRKLKKLHFSSVFDLPTNSPKNFRTAVKDMLISSYRGANLAKRLNITANINQTKHQLDLFNNYEKIKNDEDKERKLSNAILEIQSRFGKNSILKATSFEEGATMRERNSQIGGHKK